ncbi:hypothetical protein [Eubacterium xylanophilum]|uniref:hypothetical protein n=1 Tax=Eubacterium xylanophilum TaxID=39497 RepID=UPI0004AF043C|nr:hypothetical protein [Eubacterium xylanophilum]
MKKKDLACPESGFRRSLEREGACQNGEYKMGMPREWNEVVLGEGRGMPKRKI